MKVWIICLLVLAVYSEVTVKQITGVVSTKQLLFAGNSSISASSSSKLFFLFYGVQNVTDRAQLASYPTIVVMGSPSGSSQYLNLGGMGPLILANNMSLIVNNNTPNAYANLMFVDILGTGFSFASDAKEIPDNYPALAQQVGYALTQFANEIDFGRGKWVLAGESSWVRMLPYFKLSNLKGVVALSPWTQLYSVGKYYGVAGVELKIFNDAEKSAIETTFLNCYTNLRNGKFKEAHQCYDSVLNFVEQKGNNRNLYNIHWNISITPHFGLVQYYFSQPNIVALYSAPSNLLFEQHLFTLQTNTYVDEAKNYTQNISYFLRDYLDVKFLVLTGTADYITYNKATRSWMETELNFVESANFTKLNLTDVTVNGTVVARTKAVTQVTYTEVVDSGHYLMIDKPNITNSLLQSWVATLKQQELELNPATSNLRFEEIIA